MVVLLETGLRLLVEEVLHWAGSHHIGLEQAFLDHAFVVEADSSLPERKDSGIATIVEGQNG